MFICQSPGSGRQVWLLNPAVGIWNPSLSSLFNTVMQGFTNALATPIMANVFWTFASPKREGKTSVSSPENGEQLPQPWFPPCETVMKAPQQRAEAKLPCWGLISDYTSGRKASPNFDRLAKSPQTVSVVWISTRILNRRLVSVILWLACYTEQPNGFCLFVCLFDFLYHRFCKCNCVSIHMQLSDKNTTHILLV